jgi:O-acetyl-ADP-ribose deacetylase (regulator of RNase III)
VSVRLCQITKARYFHKPTYASLESSLRAMRVHMEQHGVKHVACPRLGCGLDGLMWAQVSELLRKVFADVDCTITVYTL